VIGEKELTNKSNRSQKDVVWYRPWRRSLGAHPSGRERKVDEPRPESDHGVGRGVQAKGKIGRNEGEQS